MTIMISSMIHLIKQKKKGYKKKSIFIATVKWGEIDMYAVSQVR